MYTAELSITGIVLRSEIPLEVTFHGEVDSISNKLSELKRKRNIPYNLRNEFKSACLEPIVKGKYLIIDLDPPERLIDYFIAKQKPDTPDYFFVGAHEEGHILDETNNNLLIERLLLSKNIDINLSNIQNKEVLANITGLYVLDREGFSFDELSYEYRTDSNVKDAIRIYNSARNA